MIDTPYNYKHATLENVTRFRHASAQNLAFSKHFHEHVTLISYLDLVKSHLFEVFAHRPVAENIQVPFRHKIEPVGAAKFALRAIIIASCHKKDSARFEQGMNCPQQFHGMRQMLGNFSHN